MRVLCPQAFHKELHGPQDHGMLATSSVHESAAQANLQRTLAAHSSNCSWVHIRRDQCHQEPCDGNAADYIKFIQCAPYSSRWCAHHAFLCMLAPELLHELCTHVCSVPGTQLVL